MGASAGSDKRTLLINAVANWVGFAAQLVAAFYLAPLLVHGLGDRRSGIWSLVESILAYLMLFDLGVAASVVRYVARFEAAGDQEGLNRVFSTSLCIFAAAGALVLGLALGLAWLGLGRLGVPPDLLGEGQWMLALLGLNLALGLPLAVFPSVLDGLGRFPGKTMIRTASLVLRSILFVVILQQQGGLIALAAAVTVCNLLEHLALAAAAWYYLPGLRFSPTLVDRATFRAIRGYSLDALLAMVAGRVSFQTDAVVLGAFLGPQHITFFAIGAKLVETAKGSLRALTTVLTPAVSAREACGDEATIRRLFLDGTRWVQWLILPVQVGLLLLGGPFLALWMGPRYVTLSYPTLCILTVPLGLAMAQSTCSRILYGVGRLRWFSRAVLLEAVANLLLSVVLVRPLGVEGVALGTALPNLICNVAVALHVCHLLGVPVWEYLRQGFLAPLALAGGLALLWGLLVLWTPPTSWTGLLLTGGAGMSLYLVAAGLAEVGPMVVLQRLRSLSGAAPREPAESQQQRAA